MPNLKRSLGIVICLLLFSVKFLVSAQTSAAVPRLVHPAAEQLEHVQIHAHDITSFFAELSILYDIPIGLETAANEPELSSYSIDFKSGTLADLLTQFVSQHSLYAWKVEEGVVNVFRKDGYRDAVYKELLPTKIQKFSVKANTSCWNLVRPSFVLILSFALVDLTLRYSDQLLGYALNADTLLTAVSLKQRPE